MNKIHAFFIMLVVFMAADVATTQYALYHGIGREGNPAMAYIVTIPVLFITIKTIGTAALVYLLTLLQKKSTFAANTAMICVLCLMTGVIINNLGLVYTWKVI